jgi:hypothetical protein
MVALQISDCAEMFLFPAPVNEFCMNLFFITGQCNPKIKNITQKYQIVSGPFNGREHLKKGCMIAPGFAYMGIGNNDHNICLTFSIEKSGV